MKFLTTSLVAVVAIFVGGCSSSPSSMCHDSIKTSCDLAFECTETQDEAFTAAFGADAAACETMMNDGYTMTVGGIDITIDGADCDNVTEETTCSDTAMPNYDSGAAKDCMAGFNDRTCDDYNNASWTPPSACSDVCTAD